jgi:hypothetical protein
MVRNLLSCCCACLFLGNVKSHASFADRIILRRQSNHISSCCHRSSDEFELSLDTWYANHLIRFESHESFGFDSLFCGCSVVFVFLRFRFAFFVRLLFNSRFLILQSDNPFIHDLPRSLNYSDDYPNRFGPFFSLCDELQVRFSLALI